MSFSSLLAAAAKEADQSKLTCCILTRNGGCKRECSKYVYSTLIDKFELYRMDPPVLKEGYSESSRICREHNIVHPRKYQQDERPTNVVYESVVDFLEREDELEDEEEGDEGDEDASSQGERLISATSSQLLSNKNIGGVDGLVAAKEEAEDAQGNVEGNGSGAGGGSESEGAHSDGANNDDAENEDGENEEFFERSSRRRDGGKARRAGKRDGPHLQERHCIYLKVDDDERCRNIAQTMGLARGPNGYNRSGLLAHMPRIVTENNKLKAQIQELEQQVREMQRHSTAVHQNVVICEASTVHSLPSNAAVSYAPTSIDATQSNTLAGFTELSNRISAIPTTDNSSMVHLLATNLSEDELIQIVNLHGDGKLKKFFHEQHKKEITTQRRRERTAANANAHANNNNDPTSTDVNSATITPNKNATTAAGGKRRRSTAANKMEESETGANTPKKARGK